MENAIRDYLREHTDIKTIVGTYTVGSVTYAKVYQGIAPQGTPAPYVTIKLISKPRRQFGARQYRFQFSCYSPAYGQAKAIAKAIETALEDMDGLSNIFAVYPENEVDLYENDTNLHHIPLDVLFIALEKPIFNE
ncbi:Protein of unknown function [Anaerovirgula multivorans]|uniref:Uncharacterized protein n=1 Tax=Anaerovirgula multivorans TaxID=312168 RepID=A0A239AIJ4_9FIRM|nr:DUF3168 domain-containing protein [Anaerovirgula multivorans]SNR95477.1 Protein of unknown function [Anaerovirgula multivorans]